MVSITVPRSIRTAHDRLIRMTDTVAKNDPGLVAWNALTYFNFYRFLVSFLFAALTWIGQLPVPLGI